LQAETAQKTDADTVQSMVKSLTASYDELVGKYEHLRTEMAELVRVKADDERRIAHLEMLVETMKADIHDLKVIRDDLQHRYDEAIQKLANCERKRLEAELLIAELEAELTKG
jgi:4-hydroxy-3-methylbut-2-en-1-yl diphosphate synthase IspG/GcpE